MLPSTVSVWITKPEAMNHSAHRLIMRNCGAKPISRMADRGMTRQRQRVPLGLENGFFRLTRVAHYQINARFRG